MLLRNTVCALATPPGEGGIAVVQTSMPRKLVLKPWIRPIWSAVRPVATSVPALMAVMSWVSARVTLEVLMPRAVQAALMASAGMPRM